MRRLFLHTLAAIVPTVVLVALSPAPAALGAPATPAATAEQPPRATGSPVSSSPTRRSARARWCRPARSRRRRARARRTRRGPRAAGILPGARRARTDTALQHPVRSLAAGRQLERQAAGRRQRRSRRHDQLSRDGLRAARRLRHGQHRHRPHRRGIAGWLEDRDRLIDYSYRGLHLTTVDAKAIVGAVLHAAREGSRISPAAPRRQTGTDGSAALPGGLRRHPRRRRRQLLDAPDGRARSGTAR